jgi:O-antigen ligase
MYTLFLILSTLLVVFGWTAGAGLLLLALVAPWIPRRWVWSGVRQIRGRVFVAGLVMVLIATLVFVAVDLVVPDSPAPRTSGVWAASAITSG